MTIALADLAVPDPYPQYRELREHAPVHRGPDGIWLVSRYDDVRTVQLSEHISSSPASRTDYADYVATTLDGIDGPVARWQRSMFVFMDDPEHRRLRHLFQAAFTPASITALRPRLEAAAARLMRAADTELEVVGDLAGPLTSTLIGELLGVPEHARAACLRRSELTGRTLSPIVTPEDVAAAGEALAESTEFFLDLVAERRREPRDDLLTALTATSADGDRMSADEIVSSALLLFDAGHETTTALIANAVDLLLEHPDQLALLRADPTLLPSAVEEVIRFEPSFQYGLVVTREPVDLRGGRIPAGASVVVLLAAANRDPAQFPDPDRFLISRTPNRHVSFGPGRHHCLGAPLARLEAQVALRALLDAWPAFGRRAGARRPDPSWSLRTFEHLPIRRL